MEKRNNPALDNVLIVEDSKTFSALLVRAVKKELHIEPTLCRNYNEASQHLETCAGDYFAALLDLNLPDAPNGEIVDLVTEKGIAAIVFTGEISDDLRDAMWSKRIVDYVLKETPDNVQLVINLARRLKENIGRKVLVADDSTTNRKLLRSLLEAWNFTVLEARDGQEALTILQEEKNIYLLITDYNMPRMDGVALIREVRRTLMLSKSRLPIIGLSGAGGATTSAHFIKAGANDYLHKPFLTEELYCRILHNLENSEYIATIRNMAERDFLTNLYNRRSFFAYSRKLLARTLRQEGRIAIVMLDIDHFKRCNDTYGHDAGDEVIRFVANTLLEHAQNNDIVARFGGEEFCIALADAHERNILAAFESLRKRIANSIIHFNNDDIQVTISIGICSIMLDNLERMIKMADDMLYEAKNGGRNQVRQTEVEQ